MATNETGQVEWDAANCLRVDHATVEAVDALRAAGVRPVLLKGPVIAQWLYADDPSQRAYNDTDLLVAPDDLAPAAEVLDGLGYRPVSASGLRFRHQVPRHARCWFRDRDRAAIDLHRTIHGTERLDPALVWGAAVEQPETVDVLGTRMEVPGEPFRLLHLVLHIRPKDHPGSRAWTDLERAVEVVPDDRWRGAVRLAERLGVAGSTGPLLRLSDRGGELADRLGFLADGRRISGSSTAVTGRRPPGSPRTSSRSPGQIGSASRSSGSRRRPIMCAVGGRSQRPGRPVWRSSTSPDSCWFPGERSRCCAPPAPGPAGEGPCRATADLTADDSAHSARRPVARSLVIPWRRTASVLDTSS